MNSNSTTTVGSDVWSELWKHSEQFFSNILELQNIDLEKLTSYGESLLKHMGGVDTASTDRYKYTCNFSLILFISNILRTILYTLFMSFLESTSGLSQVKKLKACFGFDSYVCRYISGLNMKKKLHD